MEKNDLYYKDIANTERLSSEEEKRLSKQIKTGNRRALNQLVTANLKYVVKIAAQYKNQGMDMEELISEGNMGMIKAAENFDGDKNVRFTTFATPHIKKAIEQAIQKQAVVIKSVDAPIPEGSKNTISLLHVLENTNAEKTDDKITREIEKDQLKNLLHLFTEREQQVMKMLCGFESEAMTLQEVANEMQLKRERVRQIRNDVLRKIKKQRLLS